MNRSLWTQNLGKYSCPAWPCPVCKKGSIVLTPKSLVYQETEGSKRERKYSEDWDPDWTSSVFTARGECKHPSCKEVFVIAGKGGLEMVYDADGDWDWDEYFSPLICHPMPDMFDIPTKCPSEVKDELRAAFSIFWLNSAACASRLRVALECLMNHLGVPRKRKDNRGKYYEPSLHARIDDFAKHEPSIGPQLIALKWLGNAGSHHGAVKREEVLDALEIMEHALIEIVEQRSTRVAHLAKKLTKKHALPRRKKQ